MAKTSSYYVVYMDGRKLRVRGMSAVAGLIGVDPHRVARALRSGKAALYVRYPKGVARFEPAVSDGIPYGSVVIARCREPGFEPRGYTSRLSLARSFGVTRQSVHWHLAKGTPLKDQFGYLWDLEATSSNENPFADKGGDPDGK